MAIFTFPSSAISCRTRWPRGSEPRIDLASLAFVVLLSVLAALLFGTLPALILSRPELSTALRQGGTITKTTIVRGCGSSPYPRNTSVKM